MKRRGGVLPVATRSPNLPIDAREPVRITAATSPEPGLGDVLGRLGELSAGRGDQLALRQLVDGSWVEWAWTDIARDVTRLIAGLDADGLVPGMRVGFAGPITPNLLLAALACRAAGAEFALPGEPTPDYLFTDTPVPTTARLILDAAEVDGGQGVAFRSLLRHAWIDPGEALGGIAHNSVRAGLEGRRCWLDARADEPGALALVLRQWLDSELSLGLPGSTATAEQDRALFTPELLMIPSSALDELGLRVRRAMTLGAWGSRQVETALRRRAMGQAGRIAGMIAGMVRHATGLAGIRAILVFGDEPAVDEAETTALFAGLDISVASADHQGRVAVAARERISDLAA